MDVNVLFDTPGVGGAVAIVTIVSLVTCYYLTLKWIAKGQEDRKDNH